MKEVQKNKKVVVGIKIPIEFREKIKKISEKTGIKIGHMTVKAFEEYIENHKLLDNLTQSSGNRGV